MKNRRNLLIIILFIIVFISGCGINSWKKKIQVSDLKYEDNYVKGKIKNMTDDYLGLRINFEYESGSLKLDSFCYQDIKGKEVLDLECLEYKIDNTYKIKIKDIKMTKKEVPSLKNGKIDKETLEYYYKDMLDSHIFLMYSTVKTMTKIDNYPYITEIRNTSDDEIDIEYKQDIDTTSYTFIETYSKKDNKLKKLYIFMYGEPDIQKLALGLSTTEIFGYKLNQAKNMYDALTNEIEFGYCKRVNEWCVSYTKDKELPVSTIDIYEYESK